MPKRRSPCPVACTLDLLGDRWTLLVVRDLFAGKTTYKEFLASPEKIATNTLADRLAQLVKAKLVTRLVANPGSNRVVYQLTDRGRSLMPILQAVADWGLTHIKGTQMKLKPVPGPAEST